MAAAASAAAPLTSLPLFVSPRRFSSAITKKPFLFSFLAPQNPSFRSSCRSNPTRRIHMKAQNGIDTVGDNAFVLEDVPYLTALLPQLTAYPSPIRSSPAYGIVKQSFVTSEDVVAQRVVTYTSFMIIRSLVLPFPDLFCDLEFALFLSPWRFSDCCAKKTVQEEVHFRRAGPREKPEEVCACIVTCGGLCPGINTVIREIVRGLNFLYGVNNIIGIEVDDILTFGTKHEKILKIKDHSSRNFDIKKLREADIIVGMKVFGSLRGISLRMSLGIEKITEGKVVKLRKESIHVVVLGFCSAAIMSEDIIDEFKHKIKDGAEAFVSKFHKRHTIKDGSIIRFLVKSLDEVLHITGSLIPTHTGCVCWLSKHGAEGGQLIDRNLKRYRVRDVKNEVEDQQPGLSTEHDQSLNHNRPLKSRKRSVED